MAGWLFGAALVGWGLKRFSEFVEEKQREEAFVRELNDTLRSLNTERHVWETQLERHPSNTGNSTVRIQQNSVQSNRDFGNTRVERSQYNQDLDNLTTGIQRMRFVIEEYDENYFPVAEKVDIYFDGNVSVQRPLWMTARTPLEMEIVYPFSLEYQGIVDPILNGDNKDIKIQRVFKITNRYLERQFELKKLQNPTRYYREHRMYHTTLERNVLSICKNNFNWRLSGLSRGSKYGIGVSFTPYPDFAHQFCRNKNVKIMFVVKVLIGQAHVGTKEQELPNNGFDATCAPSRKVFVKFEDSEFYPEYVVYYRLH